MVQFLCGIGGAADDECWGCSAEDVRAMRGAVELLNVAGAESVDGCFEFALPCRGGGGESAYTVDVGCVCALYSVGARTMLCGRDVLSQYFNNSTSM